MIRKMLGIAILAVVIFAAPIDEMNARNAAETQIEGHSMNDQLATRNTFVKRITPVIDGDVAIAYIAELNPKGFIAISTDSDIRPIIAFSYINDFDFSNSENNVAKRMLVQDMRLRRDAMPFTAQMIIDENNTLWQNYIDKDIELIHSLSTTTIVGPLVDTRWNQGTPYNNLCPIDPETGDRCVTGCTATSMAQIVNYWEFPSSVHFTASDSYESDSTTPPIWIDATTASMDTIDYNGVGDHPDAANKAGISWACGVSIYSIYGSTGTIAWFHDSSYTDKWGYLRAEKVDPPEWPDFYDTLHANMMTARPAQLGIFYYDPPDTSGHAIVCDGWMETGEYHLNYGWGGVSDGWYHLPSGIPAPFDIVRWAVVNIEPPRRPDAPNNCVDAIEITISDVARIHNDELTSGDEDWFRFDATTDYTYIIGTSGLTDSYGELFSNCVEDPIMSDNSSGAGENFSLIFFPESTGTYYLRVSQNSPTVPYLYNLRYYRTAPPSIILNMPSGGEVINDESNLVLMWTRDGTPDIPAVTIEYSLYGAEGPWFSIEDSTANSGLYIWSIPNLDTTSHDCYVRISEFGLRRVFGINSSPFTIVDVSNIAENSFQPRDFAIYTYPNPFNSSVKIVVNGFANLTTARVEIYDVSGKLIDVVAGKEESIESFSCDNSSNLSLGKQRIAASIRKNEFIWTPNKTLPSGVYLIRASNNAESIAIKTIYMK